MYSVHTQAAGRTELVLPPPVISSLATLSMPPPPVAAVSTISSLIRQPAAAVTTGIVGVPVSNAAGRLTPDASVVPADDD